jgi:hypothetical protein
MEKRPRSPKVDYRNYGKDRGAANEDRKGGRTEPRLGDRVEGVG